MTTTGDILTPGTATPDAIEPGPEARPMPRRARVRLRLVAGFVAGLALCLGVAGGALVAWDSGYEGRVLPGVRVGGVDLSGMDRARATEALAAVYDVLGDGYIVIRTDAGDLSVLPYEAFGRRADLDAMVGEALATGRAGTLVERAVGEVRLALWGHSLELRLAMDEAAVGEAVTAALARFDVRPVDATIGVGESGIYTTRARAGRTFDASAPAAAALDAVRRLDAPREIVIHVPANTIPAARSDADVQAAWDAAERMVGDIVVTSGEKHWTIKAATVRRWLGFAYAADGSVEPVVDEAMVEQALAKVAKAVKRAPVSAVYLGGRHGKVVGVAPAKNGRRLDSAATASAIADALQARAHWIEPEPVAAVIAKVPPKLSTDEAVKKAPLMQRLGSWKTWFPVSERNYYGANIWLPAKFIDGTVLYPGQTFEWWRAVGPITTSRGFGLGGFIAGDHTEPTGAIGGGMCSSSTTLFNAALRAGLRMGARSNHRYYINRYPLGLDATVSKTAGGGGQTMTFTNDMDTPIVIRAFRYRSKGLGWVRYEIWGIPDGRTVSIGKPVVTNVREATTYKVYVSTLPTGHRVQTEYPSNGMDVSVTRVVRNRNGRVIHRDTYRSHYTLWNGRIEIGS